jgi:hypothetical protein
MKINHKLRNSLIQTVVITQNGYLLNQDIDKAQDIDMA